MLRLVCEQCGLVYSHDLPELVRADTCEQCGGCLWEEDTDDERPEGDSPEVAAADNAPGSSASGGGSLLGGAPRMGDPVGASIEDRGKSVVVLASIPGRGDIVQVVAAYSREDRDEAPRFAARFGKEI